MKVSNETCAKTYFVIFKGICQHRELLFSCHRELLFSTRKVILLSSRITKFSKSVRKVILVETRIVTNENNCPFFRSKIGRNKQFSSAMEKSNQGVVENYTIRGENYTLFVIFERRNTLIRGTITICFMYMLLLTLSGTQKLSVHLVSLSLSLSQESIFKTSKCTYKGLGIAIYGKPSKRSPNMISDTT